MQQKLIIGLGIVAAALSMYGLSHFAPTHQATHHKALVSVAVSEVIEKDVAVPFKTIGTVEPYATISVQSLVDGQLLEVGFKEGDFVKQGQLLFKIDPRPLQATLAQAQGNLASDQAKLENAKAILQRNQALIEKGYINQQDYQQLIANVKALTATVESDQAAISAASLQLDHATIRSPIDGRTGDLAVDVGNIIKANNGMALVTITQLNPIYVSFAIPQKYLPEIMAQQVKAPISVTVKVNDIKQQGELSFINNTIDPNTDTIQLKATFVNDDQVLWPGQFVGVKLSTRYLPHALLVPSSAIMQGQQGAYVYILNADHSVTMRTIKIGPMIGNNTVITVGVKAGEKVVTAGQLRLSDGMKVQVGGNQFSSVS